MSFSQYCRGLYYFRGWKIPEKQGQVLDYADILVDGYRVTWVTSERAIPRSEVETTTETETATESSAPQQKEIDYNPNAQVNILSGQTEPTQG
jgi:hypothetical protein